MAGKRVKIDPWKVLIVVMFVWIIVNTYYLNNLYALVTGILPLPINTTWYVTQQPQIEIPTSSTAITGYFLLASSPLLLSIVLAVVLLAILLYKELKSELV